MKKDVIRRWMRRLVERLSGRSERLIKEQWLARVEAHNKTGAELTALREQLPLVLGALDSCAVALADHGHHWTEGERTIYDQAVEILERESPLNAIGEARADNAAPIPPATL